MPSKKKIAQTTCADSMYAVTQAWNELKAYGYVTVKRMHAHGRFVYEYAMPVTPVMPGTEDSEAVESAPADPENHIFSDERDSDGRKISGKMTSIDERRETVDLDQLSENAKKEEGMRFNLFKKSSSGNLRQSSQPEKAAAQAYESQPKETAHSFFDEPQDANMCYDPVRNPFLLLSDWVNAKIVGAQINYKALAKKEGEEFAKEIVWLMQDVYNAADEQRLRIGGSYVPAAAVKERFRELDYEKVQSVMLHFKQNAAPIKNPRAYLLTALYNEPTVYHHSIQNEVNCIPLEAYESDLE